MKEKTKPMTSTVTTQLNRAIDTLRRLDEPALGMIADRARFALNIQEGVKANLLKRLQPVCLPGETEQADPADKNEKNGLLQ